MLPPQPSVSRIAGPRAAHPGSSATGSEPSPRAGLIGPAGEANPDRAATGQGRGEPGDRRGAPVRIDIPNGIEFELAEIGSASTKATGSIELDLDDSYGQFNLLRHSGTGVVHARASTA